MKISLAADHNGFDLKKEISDQLENEGHEVIDVGPHSHDPLDDYPDYAKKLADSVSRGESLRGIMICGSGVGASVASNKVKGIRAAVCHDIYSAHQGVEHDDMNVLCLGSRIVGTEVARELVKAFIGAEYTGQERHQRGVEGDGCKGADGHADGLSIVHCGHRRNPRRKMSQHVSERSGIDVAHCGSLLNGYVGS